VLTRDLGVVGTAVELSNRDRSNALLPLFARHDGGVGRGEKKPNKTALLSSNPPFGREEREKNFGDLFLQIP
jgi:hypothetical protein